MMKPTRFVLFVWLACILVVHVARGQRLDGTLRVTVIDKTGAVVEDARVRVTNEATNVSKTATASSAGTYVFPDLLVGDHAVTVEKPGFQKWVSKGIQVQSNQVAEATAMLQVGDVSSVIEYRPEPNSLRPNPPSSARLLARRLSTICR
jgi:Carboxypeptidase regulatory-like domain